MAVTVATPAYGTLLKRNGTAIAEVTSIDGPGMSLNLAEVTNMESPSAFVERIATVKDGGTVGFSVNWLPNNATQSGTAGIVSDFLARTKQAWSIMFTDSATTTWTFSGFVSSVSPSASSATDALTCDFEITITGAVTAP